MPALATTMSTGPSASSTRRAASATWPASATSAGTATPRPPMSDSTSSRSAVERATSPTRAPRPAACRATARPMPRDAPVTRATARSQQVDGQLGQRLGQVAPLELGQWHLGPVGLALQHLGEGPVVEEPRVLDVRVGPGDALT